MSKHTPGPWVYAESGPGQKVTTVAHCAGFVIGLASDIEGGNYRNGDPSGDEEADARLIAAAPELLEALLDVLLQRQESMDGNGAREIEVISNARAAISKATGDSK